MTTSENPPALIISALTPACQHLVANADRIFREDPAAAHNILAKIADEAITVNTEEEERLASIAMGVLIATTDCREIDFTCAVEPYFLDAAHQKRVEAFQQAPRDQQGPSQIRSRLVGFGLLACYTKSLMDESEAHRANDRSAAV